MADDVSPKTMFNSPLTMVLALVLAVAVYRAPEIIKALKPSPVAPIPGPVVPVPIATLEARVAQAMGEDRSAALKYAALYAVATNVVGDTGRPPRQIQEEIGRAVGMLGLPGTDEFKTVVRDHLKPYGGPNADREQWRQALTQLSTACFKAAE